MPIGNALNGTACQRLEGIALQEDRGSALRFWNLPSHPLACYCRLSIQIAQ